MHMKNNSSISPLLYDLDYTIITGKDLFDRQPTELHNKAYAYWKAFWRNVFKDNGLQGDVLRKEDFLREDFITILSHKGEIAGMHLYCQFDLELEATRDHVYFMHNYGSQFTGQLRENGIRNIMTIEYLTVDPAWRKSKVGASLGHVFCALGAQIASYLEVDAAVSACRMDVGANEMLAKCGGISYGKTDLYNTPVEYMVIPRNLNHPHSDPLVAGLVDHYWSNRVDLTTRLPKRTHLKIAV